MKARNFSYVKAATVAEAIAAYDRFPDNAAYLSGGQSLIPALAMRMMAPDIIVDLSCVPALKGVTVQDGRLRIGALTRHVDVMREPLIRRHAPLLAAAVPYIAHPAIRNVGTIGGSVALADPSSEFPALMLATGASLEITAKDLAVRLVKADDFFLSLYTTAISPGEILTAIHVPVLADGEFWAFDELARRRGDYAIVGCGLRGSFVGDTIADVRIAFFSVGNTPVRVRTAERALVSQPLTPASIAMAKATLADDLDPPDDAQIPREARLHLARVLLGRVLGQVLMQRSRTA